MKKHTKNDKTFTVMKKVLTIKDSDFKKIKEYTDNGWVVSETTRVSDSKTQYTLTKPDTDKKIKG